MMFKMKCHLTDEEFEINLSQYMTLTKCPKCDTYIRYTYYFVGLSNCVAPEIEDGWHEILGMAEAEPK